MIEKRIATNGDEADAFSRRSRPLLHWKRGELAKIKRRAGKRSRREGKTLTSREVW